ncbi:hypothetical protein [Solidesulfovibrio magneticus]|uniref:Uncharacterized protein n=1 Tax=Solidesulfovibrio magneticus (strain ATCC 700980 / DSM 13731 / RS-1) TaxID=573370 RepID=C4XHW9_SOLM1|nr:hypothetical protein [Solidesulfovibrio magneticus]BAH76487.1 hypothetical protein DMR_29960 [Solidesulfovibrio magneticus RS-1]
MNIKSFLTYLKKHFNAKNENELATKLNISQANFSQWKNTENIPHTSIANILNCSLKNYAENCIKSIIEFHPINCVGDSNLRFLNKNDPQNNVIIQELEKHKGVYTFYDSYGKLIYVGKTKQQVLYKEMTTAFNKESKHLFMWCVDHHCNQALTTNKQIRKKYVYLHDIAKYFSAYRVETKLIDVVEALLIRVSANNNINIKMETLSGIYPPACKTNKRPRLSFTGRRGPSCTLFLQH